MLNNLAQIITTVSCPLILKVIVVYAGAKLS